MKLEEAKEYLEQFIGRKKEYKYKPIKIKTMINTRQAVETVLQALDNSISKDKIKENIEELDKEEQELQNSISDEEREEYSDASISYELSYIEAKREILEELLEDK